MRLKFGTFLAQVEDSSKVQEVGSATPIIILPTSQVVEGLFTKLFLRWIQTIGNTAKSCWW